MIQQLLLPTAPSVLPTRLEKPPLVDTLFEIRFEPSQPAVGQLLPGFFLSRLQGEYPRSEPLPVGSLPPQVRDQDPNLRYQFHHRLVGDSGAVSVGDRSAGVSAFPPYQGWEQFGPRIEAFIRIISESGLINRLERFSLKFVNILPVPAETSQLELLNLDVVIGGVPAPVQGFRLRTEFNDETCVRIVEIAPNTEARLPNGERRDGVLLSVDCIRPTPTGNLAELNDKNVEDLHVQLKQIFFGLITEKTLATLEPSF